MARRHTLFDELPLPLRMTRLPDRFTDYLHRLWRISFLRLCLPLPRDG
jgi:hypothetical protein